MKTGYNVGEWSRLTATHRAADKGALRCRPPTQLAVRPRRFCSVRLAVLEVLPREEMNGECR